MAADSLLLYTVDRRYTIGPCDYISTMVYRLLQCTVIDRLSSVYLTGGNQIMPNFVIASPKGGVGKSTAANILMTCLARRGASVTGIDADLNRPQIKWAKRAGVRTPSDPPDFEPKVLPTLTV